MQYSPKIYYGYPPTFFIQSSKTPLKTVDGKVHTLFPCLLYVSKHGELIVTRYIVYLSNSSLCWKKIYWNSLLLFPTSVCTVYWCGQERRNVGFGRLYWYVYSHGLLLYFVFYIIHFFPIYFACASSHDYENKTLNHCFALFSVIAGKPSQQWAFKGDKITSLDTGKYKGKCIGYYPDVGLFAGVDVWDVDV